MTFNWSFALQQALIAAIAGTLGLTVIALATALGARRGSAARLWLELPAVAFLQGIAGTFCMELGWGRLLPGAVLAWTVGVAMAFYWLALWWPVRVFWHGSHLGKSRGGIVTLAAAVCLVLGAVYSTAVEPQMLEVERRVLELDDARVPIRLAHLSDIQLIDLSPRDHAVVEAVNAFDPHLIVITGDYIASSPDDEVAIAAVRTVLSRLHAQHGVFATNSDSDDEAQRARIFAGLPIRYLFNENVTVEIEGVTVRVGGLDHYEPDFDAVQRGALAGELFVVGCHWPDLALPAAELIPTADLYLCGHTHGGQLQVPWFGPLLTFCQTTPRHMAAGGVFEVGRGLPVAITRGIGTEGGYAPRFRFNCRPHLFLLTLHDAAA